MQLCQFWWHPVWINWYWRCPQHVCSSSEQVQNNQPDKEIITFAMLDTCSQGTFVTQSLMEQLSIKGIPTSVKIKTLIGHQTESSEIVKGLPVSKAASLNEQQKWIDYQWHFLKRRSPLSLVKLQQVENCKDGSILRGSLGKLVIMKTSRYNLGHNILRLFDVLSNFLFTTSETNCDY